MCKCMIVSMCDTQQKIPYSPMAIVIKVTEFPNVKSENCDLNYKFCS